MFSITSALLVDESSATQLGIKTYSLVSEQHTITTVFRTAVQTKVVKIQDASIVVHGQLNVLGFFFHLNICGKYHNMTKLPWYANQSFAALFS